MKKELTHINMVLNFNNYDSGQLKTFTEFLLKARHNSKSFVVYFSQQIISSMRTGATSVSLTFVHSGLGHCLVHRRHSINVCRMTEIMT